jgi:hypothetical protein
LQEQQFDLFSGYFEWVSARGLGHGADEQWDHVAASEHAPATPGKRWR